MPSRGDEIQDILLKTVVKEALAKKQPPAPTVPDPQNYHKIAVDYVDVFGGFPKDQAVTLLERLLKETAVPDRYMAETGQNQISTNMPVCALLPDLLDYQCPNCDCVLHIPYISLPDLERKLRELSAKFRESQRYYNNDTLAATDEASTPTWMNVSQTYRDCADELDALLAKLVQGGEK